MIEPNEGPPEPALEAEQDEGGTPQTMLDRELARARQRLADVDQLGDARAKLLEELGKQTKKCHEQFSPENEWRSETARYLFGRTLASFAKLRDAVITLEPAQRQLEAANERWATAVAQAIPEMRVEVDANANAGQVIKESYRQMLILKLFEVILIDITAAGLNVNLHLLLGAHDANAAFLGEDAWRDDRLREVLTALGEDMGETALTEWIAPTLVVLLGIGAGPAGLAVGVAFTAAKIVIRLTESKTEAALQRMSTLDSEALRMESLLHFNEQAAAATEDFATKIHEANNALADLFDEFNNATRNFRFERDAGPHWLEEAETLDSWNRTLDQFGFSTKWPDSGRLDPGASEPDDDWQPKNGGQPESDGQPEDDPDKE